MNLSERLSKLYGNPEQPKTKADWIPKRLGNDPIAQLKRTLPKATELSQNRASDLLEDQSTRETAALLIREQAEITLKELCGEKKIEIKMEHFDQSWEKIMNDEFEEDGETLLLAMLEMANEGELVGYDGYIDKKNLKKKLKELRKRNRG